MQNKLIKRTSTKLKATQTTPNLKTKFKQYRKNTRQAITQQFQQNTS